VYSADGSLLNVMLNLFQHLIMLRPKTLILKQVQDDNPGISAKFGVTLE